MGTSLLSVIWGGGMRIGISRLAWLLLAVGLVMTERVTADLVWPLSDERQAALQQRLIEQLNQERFDGEVLVQRKRVQRFYARRNHSAAWSNKESINPGVQELLAVLNDA